MLNFFVLVTLPVTLRAWQLCQDESCQIASRQARIIGGDITEQNSRPFQVALYSRVGTTGEVGFCGGALVHPEWVLTAAHCCYHHGQQVDNVQAILGAHSLYDRYENGRRIVNVDEVRVHPDWDPDSFANDVALMRLANVMQLTETIDVVRLPYLNISNFNFAGMGATVSGWGIAAPGVVFVSPTLREKLMTVMTDTMCNIQYFNQLPPDTVCGFHATAGTCKGDNGGPMTIWYNATEEVILLPTLSVTGSDFESLGDDWSTTLLGNDPIASSSASSSERNLQGQRSPLRQPSLNWQGLNDARGLELSGYIGVASFVDASGCNDELPSVFTRVQRYLQWISDNTGIALV